MSYKEKYLKYKTKYSLLKEQKGGGNFLTDDDYDEDLSYAMFNFSPDFLEKKIDGPILCGSFFHCYVKMYVSFYHHDIFNGDRQLFLNYIEFLKKFIVITNFFRIARELTKTIDTLEIQIYKNILLSTSINPNPKKFLSELKSIFYDPDDGFDIFYDDIYPVDKEIELWHNLAFNFPTFKTYIQNNSTHPTTVIVERNNALDRDRRTFEYNRDELFKKKRDDPINSKPFLDYLNEQILTICSKNELDYQDIYKDYYININRREHIVMKMDHNIEQLRFFRDKIYDMFSYHDYFPNPGVSLPSKLPDVNKRLTIIGYKDLMYQLKTKYCIPKIYE